MMGTMRLSRLALSVVCCFAVGIGGACSATKVDAKAVTKMVQTPQSEDLFRGFVDMLNSKDKEKARAFFTANFDPAVPVENRVSRSGMLFDHAPFKLLKIGTTTPQESRALIEDKDGQKQTFIMQFTADGKVKGIMIGPPEEVDGKPPKNYTGWKSLASLAADVAADSESPGMEIAVIRDGKLEEAATGVRETGKPAKINVDDPMSVGSIGKPLCTSVIASLIEEGKLRWDETLKEALPGTPMLPEYEDIPIEAIMHHRGGIPEDLGFRRPEVQKIVGSAISPTQIRENYVKNILSRPVIAKVNEKFAYSNAGFALLSRVAEVAAGKPYEQLLKERIFEKLGLKHSFIGADNPKDIPVGHIAGPEGLRPMRVGGPMESMFAGAGGGINMSAADLATFGQAHLNGLLGKDGFLKATTIKRLHEGFKEEAGMPRSYACGWGIEQYPGAGLSHGHNGSNGTMRSQLLIFPEKKLVIVAIVNRGGEMEPSPSLQAALAVARK